MRCSPDANPSVVSEDAHVTDREQLRARTTGQVAKLIELGRDREAAKLGASGSRRHDQAADNPQLTGQRMDPLEQLDHLAPALGNVVANISPDQLDRPTPCTSFTVRGVLDHMIGGATMFAAAFRGQAPATGDPALGVLDGFGPALTDLATAMHEPGVLDRTMQTPFGEMPGTAFARFVVLDGLVHGWDLATATGQPYEPSDALVADVDGFARQTLDPLRDGDTFAAAVEPPAGATHIERLAAFTGRQLVRGT